MAEFAEVADRVWVARYQWLDVNVTAIGGAEGLLVVDTHGSAAAAREVIDDVRRLGAGPVTVVVNTHDHFDHTFGNGAFRAAFGPIPLHAHESAAATTLETGADAQRRFAADPADPHRQDVLATEVVPADHTLSSAAVLDLGDRLVELVHPGRGHTAGDLVVRVPDADAVLAGDLVEESALRNGVPSFGSDCFPLEWPATLDLVLGLVGSGTVVVPGHGSPVGRRFVEDQQDDLVVVAETIRDLAGRGVPEDQALAAADWPYPRDELVEAVRRGYAQLPRSPRRLPLV